MEIFEGKSITLISKNASLNNLGDFINNGTVHNDLAPAVSEFLETGFMNFGEYKGSGHITGDWINYGTITKPSNPLGRTILGGKYTEHGETAIELGGTDNKGFHRTESAHDFIEVKGDMVIGEKASSQVYLANGFELKLNQ